VKTKEMKLEGIQSLYMPTLYCSATGWDVWHVPLWQGMEYKANITMVCRIL